VRLGEEKVEEGNQGKENKEGHMMFYVKQV
jgi:hypothetical protein